MRALRPILPACALCLLAPAAGAQSSFFDVVSVERTLRASAGWRNVDRAVERSTFEGLGPFDLELSAMAENPETGAGGSGLAVLESQADLGHLSVRAMASATRQIGHHTDGDHEEGHGGSSVHVEYVFQALRPAQIRFTGMFEAVVRSPYNEPQINAGVLLESNGETLFATRFHDGEETLDDLISIEPGVYRLTARVESLRTESTTGFRDVSSSLDVDVHFIPAPTTATPLLLAFGAIATRRRRP